MPVLRNYMEEVLIDVLKRNIDQFDVCRCETCFYDIAALALNRVQPKYVSSSKGELFAKATISGRQAETDLIKAVTQAVEIVRKNPHHAAHLPASPADDTGR